MTPTQKSRACQRLLDGVTTASGVRRRIEEAYPVMYWLCKLHWLGLASLRPGADAQLDHFRARLEKQTVAAKPPTSALVIGKIESRSEPAA
jgi:hypothetical protein